MTNSCKTCLSHHRSGRWTTTRSSSRSSTASSSSARATSLGTWWTAHHTPSSACTTSGACSRCVGRLERLQAFAYNGNTAVHEWLKGRKEESYWLSLTLCCSCEPPELMNAAWPRGCALTVARGHMHACVVGIILSFSLSAAHHGHGHLT